VAGAAGGASLINYFVQRRRGAAGVHIVQRSASI
jgi:hypothetical protein